MAKKILAVGELLWDVLPDERKLGGAPANLAYRLNGLGNPTWLLTRVGNDIDGNEALAILKDHDFNTDYIQVDPEYSTGTVDVFFDAQKNPDYTINAPAAYDFIAWNEQLDTLATSIDCLVFGTLVQRSEQTAKTLHRLIDRTDNALIFCDINLRKDCYNEQIIKKSLQKASVVKLNHHEAIELGTMFDIQENELVSTVQKLVRTFELDICLITLEEMGALAIEKSGVIYYSPGYHVKMEDPLGAGDAFSAAFLNELMHTGNISAALEAGNLFGGIVVEQKGAMQPILKTTIEAFGATASHRVIHEEYRKFWQDQYISNK